MFGSSLGFQEILVICVILIVVVGPEKLPTMMKGVGKALRTMREASREIRTTVGIDEMLRDDVMRPPPPRPRPAPSATVARASLPSAPAQEANAPPSPPGASEDAKTLLRQPAAAPAAPAGPAASEEAKTAIYTPPAVAAPPPAAPPPAAPSAPLAPAAPAAPSPPDVKPS